MRWTGTIRATVTEDFDVEAGTEDEAIKKAEDEFKAGNPMLDCEMVEVDTIYSDDE